MSDSGDLAAFRAEVRAFLAANLPPDMAARGRRGYHAPKSDVLGWTAILHQRGWSLPGWPVEYGGPGWSTQQCLIFEEECLEAGAPMPSPQGLQLVGPVIYRVGSDEQKARYLPDIAAGRTVWAQGFSEPNSGSDLASLKTRAVLDGDHFVVNGQKIWTSDAHHAEWLFLLARTDPDAPRQKGISFLLVDMKSPGITVRPIQSIDEAWLLNEVFLDNVRVPRENLVGELNQGWTYAKTLLATERATSAEVPKIRVKLRRTREMAERTGSDGRRPIDDPSFALRLTELEIDVMAHEATVMRVLAEAESPMEGGASASSILKLRGSELLQAAEALLIEAMGPDALPVLPPPEYEWGNLPDCPVPDAVPGLVADFFYHRAATIYGGTSDIQRNLIAGTLLRAAKAKA